MNKILYLPLLVIFFLGCSPNDKLRITSTPSFKAGDCVVLKDTHFYSNICHFSKLDDVEVFNDFSYHVKSYHKDVRRGCPPSFWIHEKDILKKTNCPKDFLI
jgi:hypothetical protein